MKKISTVVFTNGTDPLVSECELYYYESFAQCHRGKDTQRLSDLSFLTTA